jgi:hypothetical protein
MWSSMISAIKRFITPRAATTRWSTSVSPALLPVHAPRFNLAAKAADPRRICACCRSRLLSISRVANRDRFI